MDIYVWITFVPRHPFFGRFIGLFTNVSAIPILRRVNLKDAKLFEKETGITSTLRLIAIWAAIETRQLVHTTVREIEKLVEEDRLAPNY